MTEDDKTGVLANQTESENLQKENNTDSKKIIYKHDTCVAQSLQVRNL